MLVGFIISVEELDELTVPLLSLEFTSSAEIWEWQRAQWSAWDDDIAIKTGVVYDTYILCMMIDSVFFIRKILFILVHMRFQRVLYLYRITLDISALIYSTENIGDFFLSWQKVIVLYYFEIFQWIVNKSLHYHCMLIDRI